MTTNSMNPGVNPVIPTRMSGLEILFFILGVPNIYAFLKRRKKSHKSTGAAHYLKLVLAAGAIAALAELSFHRF